MSYLIELSNGSRNGLCARDAAAWGAMSVFVIAIGIGFSLLLLRMKLWLRNRRIKGEYVKEQARKLILVSHELGLIWNWIAFKACNSPADSDSCSQCTTLQLLTYAGYGSYNTLYVTTWMLVRILQECGYVKR